MVVLAYTAAEAALTIGVSESHLRRMAKKGEGPPRVVLGRRLLFPKSKLHAWLDETAVSPAGGSHARDVGRGPAAPVVGSPRGNPEREAS